MSQRSLAKVISKHIAMVLTLSMLTCLFIFIYLSEMEKGREFEHKRTQVSSVMAVILEMETKRLVASASDWAEWDETYDFVNNPKQSNYVEDYLRKDNLSNLGIDVMDVLNSTHQSQGSVYLEGTVGIVNALSNISAQYIEKIEVGEYKSGFWLFGGERYILAAAPISDTAGVQPVVGTLMMLKKFDIEDYSQIARSMGFDFLESSLDSEGDNVFIDTTSGHELFYYENTESDISNYQSLGLISNKEAGNLRAVDIKFHHDYDSIKWLVISVLVFILYVIVSKYIRSYIIKSIFNPLEVMIDELGRMNRDTSTFREITNNKTIEAAGLSKAINSLFTELVKKNQFSEFIIDVTKDNVAIINERGEIVESNDSFLNWLGLRKEEVMKQAIDFLLPVAVYESLTISGWIADASVCSNSYREFDVTPISLRSSCKISVHYAAYSERMDRTNIAVVIREL